MGELQFKNMDNEFRKKIVDSIKDQQRKIMQGEPSAITRAQLNMLESQKLFFEAVPNGFPVPLKTRHPEKWGIY